MKTAILTACWLSAVLGISITPVLAQTSNQVPHDVDCKQFMILKGFMDQVQLRCNFANVAEGNYRETARECAPQLGNPKAETLIAFGTKSFEDMEKQESKLDQLCEDMRLKIPGLIVRSEYVELDQFDSKVHDLVEAGSVREALQTARAFEKKARGIFGAEHAIYANALKALVVTLMLNGAYTEAVHLQDRLLVLQEKLFGSESNEVAESLNNLAETLRQLHNTERSVQLFRRALTIHQHVSGYRSDVAAETMLNLANALATLDNYQEAELLYDNALAILKADSDHNHLQIASAIYNIGVTAKSQGHSDRALTLYEKALEISERGSRVNYFNVSLYLETIGDELLERHNYQDAASYYRRALNISETELGVSHPRTASLLDKVGRVVLSSAYTSEHRVDSMINVLNEYIDVRRRASKAALLQEALIGQDNEAIVDKGVYARHLLALNFAKNAKWGIIEKLDLESFEIGQAAIRSSVDLAVRQMAVRFTKEDSKLASVVREQQEYLGELRKADDILFHVLGTGNAQQILSARQHKSMIEFNIYQLSARISLEFPSLDSTLYPKPLGVEATHRLLKPDEAMIVFFANTPYLNIWVVTHDKLVWRVFDDGQYRFDPNSLVLQPRADKTMGENLISRFRRGLEFDKLADGKDELFDLGFSYELYHRLFGEIEAEVKDKHHLLIVPSGALTALPFQLLVTEKPPIDKPTQDQLKAYRDAAWIVKRHAITILPSVRSLESLRSLASKPWGPKTMIGFGDPVFDPVAVADKRGESAHRGLTGNADYTEFWKGADLDRDKLRHALGRLPDTAKELRDVAASLNVPSSDIHLGADASETTVKQAKLSDYRIIYFATHGLVAGDVKGVGEPSLALSLPSQPSDFDDGLLTASEIAQLKLNADWVVLSACNTIAGEKPGAEALSGLARAFFYAGARSLLVSHWAGESKATARIATKTFEIMTQKPGTGRAEALRLAMVDFLNDEKDQWNSYPAFWGAFSLIGGGSSD